ncbi:GMC oxidoreductase [Amylostereum chailletii]|nr:GMC oxidoreductase [Amylostereum chailletii]
MANTLVTLDQVAAKTFDYIIVGGGPAGLVLATRLSEDSTRSVLVLEAGGAHFDDPNIGNHGKIFGKEEYDWRFTTLHGGKGLGGSSATNFYLWHRPAKEDVDAWEALGNPGWNWNNFLKYSMKCETYAFCYPMSCSSQGLIFLRYSLTGPLAIAFPTTRPGYDVIVQDTFEKLGVRRILEPQGGIRNGSAMDLTSVDPRTNRRVTSVAYLNEAGARKNLKILVNAPVAHITSSSTSEGLVANGVEFILNGQTHSVSATSELTSSSTIKSPQILELSGIGDFTILSGLGIETKVFPDDLPTVGTNVQDHLLGGLAFELADPDKWNTVDPLVDPAVVEEQLKLYTKGEGMFTIGAVGITMVPMDALSARAIEIGANSPTGGSSPGLAEQRIQQAKRLKEGGAVSEIITLPGFYSFPKPPRPGAKHLSLLAIYNCPFSRGTIHAASTDPLVQPAIDPHYFEDDIDRQTMIEQFKVARKLAATEPFKSVLGCEVNPGPEVQTDEEISVWLKKDKGGVVDPQLKVYGTTNVRVVDISVVPLIPSGHMQAIAYAIAEQAADIIKGAFKA